MAGRNGGRAGSDVADAARRGPETDDARNPLAILRAVAASLASVVRADTEVIVHDLTRPEASIAKIVNGHVSGRRAGQPIIAGLFGDRAFDAVISEVDEGGRNAIKVIDHYSSTTSDGRVLRSSSVILFDEAGRPTAALCLNVDPTAIDMLQRAVDGLLREPDIQPDAGDAADTTVDELVETIIAGAIQSFDVPVARLSKREKMMAVATMHGRGLFLLRGSAELVAKRLGTTKFTIYNYLEEIGRNRPPDDRRP